MIQSKIKKNPTDLAKFRFCDQNFAGAVLKYRNSDGGKSHNGGII